MSDNIIFCDLDGTLLNSQHRITSITKQAILKRIKAGDTFIPVSARFPKAIKKITNQITNQFSFPIIAYNGALILDQNGNPIFQTAISASIAFQICSLIDRCFPSLAWNVYANQDQWFVKNESNPLIIHEENNVHCLPTEISTVQIKNIKPIYKIMILGENDLRLQAKNKLRDTFKNLNIVNLIEITSSLSNKGKAVKFLAQNSQNTYAFGDRESDIPMLENVTHPYAMGNADQKVKQIISQATKSNDQNGVAYILQQLK